ncbi:hypothetical protein [Ferruginibacter sp.]
MKINFLIILLLYSLNSFSQSLFDERKVDSIDSKLDSILIIGVGSSISELFLENISRFTIQGLNKRNVIAKYKYLGQNIEDAKVQLDSINKAGYKAILLFLPKSAPSFNVQNMQYKNTPLIQTGLIKTTNYISTAAYLEEFDFQLCMTQNNMKKVWNARVGVGSDLIKVKNVKKIAKKIISCFKTNKYIN